MQVSVICRKHSRALTGAGVAFGLAISAGAVLHESPARADESNSQIATMQSPPEEQKEKPFVRATRQYRARMWAEAAEDFGMALPSEFNNPLLHYYYANCMVHLKHKEAAIREYRIAYALQPVGTIGNYCKQCLDKFGIDAEGKKNTSAKPASSKADTKKPTVEIPEPPSGSELAALKVYPKDGSEVAVEREKSVQNLRDLMQAKKHKNGAPLPVPVGTNFYVRNYKGQQNQSPASGSNKSGEEPATQSPGGSAAKHGVANKPVEPVEKTAPAAPPQKKKLGLWWW